MKFYLALLASSILSIQAKSLDSSSVECYSKLDCKVLNIISDAITSGKGDKCGLMSDTEEATICQLLSFGLNKDQAELAWKIFPSANKCKPQIDKGFKYCIKNCDNLKSDGDKDQCLEMCVLTPKIKSEECLDKLANKSTSNAAKNAKCMTECDRDTYSEIFDCQYNCHKDVVDTLVAQNSKQLGNDDNSDNSKNSSKLDEFNTKSNNGTKPTGNSTGNSTESSSKPSSSSNPGQSNSIIDIQNKSLTIITLPILMLLILL